MKKINITKICVIIIAVFLVMGVFLVGITGAISFEIIEKDFTEEITTISIDGICTVERTLFGDLKSDICKEKEKEKEKEDKEKYDILVNQDYISITKDPDTNVIRVSANPPQE